MINTMKKIKMLVIAAGLFSILMIFLPTLGMAGPPVLPPPPVPWVNIPAPPFVVVIPGAYVYFAPDIAVDLLFYHGYWYRPFEGRWYRGPHYNGPWVNIPPRRVPPPLLNLPRDYRRLPTGHQRIPHEQLQKNWRTWEREKHWDGRR
jgi:hypothetical protein